jgi:ABC-type glutathione transport system ATPase component
VISEPLRARKVRKRDQVDARIAAALDEVGLELTVAGRYPSELSGGQQQRVAIARAATATPEILFADECVSALDVSVQARVLALLKRLRDEIGFALVFVTHDLAVARSLCDTILVLKEGHAVEHAERSTFFANPRHSYSRRLIAAARATHIEREEARPE